MAPGTVIVISTMGIPPPATASAAKCASSADETRTAGTIAMFSIAEAISLRFIAAGPPSGPSETSILYPGATILELVAFRRRQQVAFARDPHIQSRQQEIAQ